MSISPDRLVEIYPRLYHMAEVGTWDSIRTRGLLSTSALLDLYEINGHDRLVIESQHRPESVTINHPNYGSAVIRDQKPLRETSLRGCLVDFTPRDWYELLNGKVFFWLTEERLLRLLSARAYRKSSHCILTVDTGRLLARHLEYVELSPINSGSTLFRPQPRGSDTFQALEEYPFEDYRKRKGQSNAVAELCVDYSVPDIGELVTRVAHMRGSQEIEVLF